MKPLFCCFLISCAVLCSQPQPSQILVVDRGMEGGAQAAGVPLGRTKGAGFVGDHFRIGAAGEVWIIDTIRTWARPGESAGHAASLGDVFESVTLFGGIEAAPPKPGQPPEPECDCHNLMTIKGARLQPGADQPASPDVTVSPAAAGIRQVDFRSLRWSVPGGVDIQFGVMGVSRHGRQTWHNQAANMGNAHQLKIFDEKGKLEGPYVPDGEPVDGRAGLNVQVWGHRSAPVAIRSGGTAIEVVLRSDASFDAGRADAATLRFGPKNAAPISSRLETIEGRAALVARFRRADAGIQGAVVSACLTGRLQDGVPFEGCDLVAAK